MLRAIVLALLLITPVHAETFTLTWQNNDPDALGTSVWRKLASQRGGGPTFIGMVDKGVTTFKDEDAPDGVEVVYTVRAFSHHYYSPYSNEVKAVRPGDVVGLTCELQ